MGKEKKKEDQEIMTKRRKETFALVALSLPDQTTYIHTRSFFLYERRGGRRRREAFFFASFA